MNKNALHSVILLGALLAIAQARTPAFSAAFQDPAIRMLAAVYERVGRKEVAATLLKSERKPSDARHYYVRGLDDVRFGKTESALGNLRKAVELDANLTEAHSLMAEIYLRLERYAEAIPAFELVVASKPGDEKALHNLGFTYWKANRSIGYLALISC